MFLFMMARGVSGVMRTQAEKLSFSIDHLTKLTAAGFCLNYDA